MFDRFSIRPDDTTPPYLQLAAWLRGQIVRGALAPGMGLPSELRLTELTGLSRPTVRRGLGKLVEEGILVRRAGAGTFIARRVVAGEGALSEFGEDARRQGNSAAVVWLTRRYALPGEAEAAALEISVKTQVARLDRICLIDGAAMAVEHAIVPAAYLPELDQIGDSIYAALDELGARPVSGLQRVLPGLPSATEASLLGISEHAAIWRVERLTRREDGRPVKLNRSIIRGDYEFLSDLPGGRWQVKGR